MARAAADALALSALAAPRASEPYFPVSQFSIIESCMSAI